MADKKGIPLSVVMSPASTHDINLVTNVVDNTVFKGPKSSSKSKSRGIKRRKLQHLCLDKRYKSAEEELELIKRGYIRHIPIKKKKKGGEEEDPEQNLNRKKYSPKRWVVYREHKLMA